MPVRCTLLIGALAIFLTATNVCRADGSTSEAAELFEAAAAASARGDHVAAANAFEQAYRNAPRGATAFNAAVSWEAANQPARAADAYARALEHDDLAPDARASAQSRLAELRAVLGHVVILAPPDTVVDIEQVQGGTSPVTLYVRPGPHTLVIRDAHGVRLTRTINIVAGEALNLDLRSEAAPTPSAAPAPPPSPVPPPTGESTPRGAPLRTVGYVALGAAVVLAGAGTYLGISALNARDDFVESGNTSRSDHDRAASLRTWTNVAWAGAGVTAATAGILIFLVPAPDEPKSSRAHDGWQAGISWAGRF
jgi:tetratricopeptide (TPR) repeat protein